MSTLVAQIVLHPTATQTLKVLGTTVGRDKVYRAIQYFARFLAWLLIKQGKNVEAVRWDALKSHLGTARKLMRLGKPLEHMQAALKVLNSDNARTAEQTTTLLRQLGYAAYLIFDAVVWANSVKFINLSKEDAQKFSKRAFRFWFFGIMFSICHGMLKASRLASEAKKYGRPSWGEKNGDEASRKARFLTVEKERAALRYQFIIDLLDVWIPAAGAGYVSVNDGILGIFGFITSIMALRTQWAAVNK